jgi:hypothetical protein
MQNNVILISSGQGDNSYEHELQRQRCKNWQRNQ